MKKIRSNSWVTDKVSRAVFNTFIVIFFCALWSSPIWLTGCESHTTEERGQHRLENVAVIEFDSCEYVYFF